MKKYKWIALILLVLIGSAFLGISYFLSGGKIRTPQELEKQYDTLAGSKTMVPIYNLAQNQKVEIHFSADYEEMSEIEDITNKAVTVHTDAACEEESKVICYSWLVEEEKGCKMVVAPVSPVLATDRLEAMEEKAQEGNCNAESWQDYETYWGAAPIYYICIHYDVENKSPIALKQPEKIPFTVESEMDVPNVVGKVDEKGRLNLTWDEVAEADSYKIYQYMPSQSWSGKNNEAHRGAQTGYSDGSLFLLSETKDTEFHNFDESEKKEEEASSIFIQNIGVKGCYFVTAVKGDIESNFSAPVDTADLKLPYKIVEEYDIIGRCTSVSALPDTVKVKNIDGSVTIHSVSYYLEEDCILYGEYQYRIDGTALCGYVHAERGRRKEFPKVIKKETNVKMVEINAQLNKVPSMAVKCVIAQQGTGKETDFFYTAVKEKTEYLKQEGKKDKVRINWRNYKITADSAEEAWLAYNMIAGEKEISLKAFPSLLDPYVLEDTFQKVYLQNPYIMGVYSYEFNYEQQLLELDYTYSKWELYYRQWRLQQESKKVISQIIKKDMTEEEKEEAIYQWIVNSCKYDEEAEKAVNNQNYKKEKGSKKIEDSANAYGVIVKNSGLCQGYATAFKALCDLAGLKSCVVEGYLNGNIPHAWNMININDNWCQLDVSNNQNTLKIPYYLYNAGKDYASAIGYSMRKSYALDSEVEETEKKMQDNTKEYYTLHNLTAADMTEVEKIFLEQLTDEKIENQKETLRIIIRYEGEYFDETAFIQTVRKAFMKKGLEKRLDNVTYDSINQYIILRVDCT